MSPAEHRDLEVRMAPCWALHSHFLCAYNAVGTVLGAYYAISQLIISGLGHRHNIPTSQVRRLRAEI